MSDCLNLVIVSYKVKVGDQAFEQLGTYLLHANPSNSVKKTVCNDGHTKQNLMSSVVYSVQVKKNT